MKSHFNLPMTLANHIAQALDLPGLFLGTYGDTTIEYMHLTHSISAWGTTQNQCFILKSNHGLYGMEIFAGGNISSLVKLPDGDPVFDLLKKYKHFPDGEVDEKSKSRLFATFMFPGGVVNHIIQSPTQAGYPSADLYAGYQGMLMNIELQMERNRGILTPPIELSDLPGDATAGFVHRYRILTFFEQSGLFEQAEAPHDTEYLLIVSHRETKKTYICVKTKTYLRVLCQIHRTPLNDNWIIDLNIVKIDWKYVLPEVTREHHRIRTLKPGIVHINFLDKDTNYRCQLSAPADYDHKEVSLQLWHILQDFFAQFPED
ncbi:MAG: hypothetical protein ACPG7F_01865 [Aggregatilineales bacterium]